MIVDRISKLTNYFFEYGCILNFCTDFFSSGKKEVISLVWLSHDHGWQILLRVVKDI